MLIITGIILKRGSIFLFPRATSFPSSPKTEQELAGFPCSSRNYQGRPLECVSRLQPSHQLPETTACCEVQQWARSLFTQMCCFNSPSREDGGRIGSLQLLSATAPFSACSPARWRGVCTQSAWRLCPSHRRRWWLLCSVKASLGTAAASRKGTRGPWLSCAGVLSTTSSSKGCASPALLRGP